MTRAAHSGGRGCLFRKVRCVLPYCVYAYTRYRYSTLCLPGRCRSPHDNCRRQPEELVHGRRLEAAGALAACRLTHSPGTCRLRDWALSHCVHSSAVSCGSPVLLHVCLLVKGLAGCAGQVRREHRSWAAAREDVDGTAIDEPKVCLSLSGSLSVSLSVSFCLSVSLRLTLSLSLSLSLSHAYSLSLSLRLTTFTRGRMGLQPRS